MPAASLPFPAITTITSSPPMAKLSPDWQVVGNDLRVAGSFVFGELIDERPIVPTIQTHSTAPFVAVREEEIFGNRANWRNLQLGDRIIVRCFFPGESR